MNEGRIIEDEEVKNAVVSKRPYQKWLDANLVQLAQIPYTNNPIPTESVDFHTRQRMFGYTIEDLMQTDKILIFMSRLHEKYPD
jgi:glutamate synthase (ferredoxin)